MNLLYPTCLLGGIALTWVGVAAFRWAQHRNDKRREQAKRVHPASRQVVALDAWRPGSNVRQIHKGGRSA